jgi:hypothetical protein
MREIGRVDCTHDGVSIKCLRVFNPETAKTRNCQRLHRPAGSCHSSPWKGAEPKKLWGKEVCTYLKKSFKFFASISIEPRLATGNVLRPSKSPTHGAPILFVPVRRWGT